MCPGTKQNSPAYSVLWKPVVVVVVVIIIIGVVVSSGCGCEEDAPMPILEKRPPLTLFSGRAIGIVTAIRLEITHTVSQRGSHHRHHHHNDNIDNDIKRIIAAGMLGHAALCFLFIPVLLGSQTQWDIIVTADSISPFCAAFFLPAFWLLNTFLR